MKTIHGQEIVMSEAAMERASGFNFLACCMPLFLIMSLFPLFMASYKYEILNKNYIYTTVIFLISIYTLYAIAIKFLFFEKNHPFSIYLIGFPFHFRNFYISSLCCFIMASTHWIIIFFVILGWLLSEFIHFHDQKKNSDEKITEAFKKNFKSNPDGKIHYTPSDKGTENILKIEQPTLFNFIDKIGIIGCGIIALTGPFLIPTSQLYRDNFEPRYIIAGTLAFFLGAGVRTFNTKFSLSMRAVKLKKNGRF
ncbi:hypothetical protein [Thalassospira sp. MCCC 1A01428]|uniref:hypothetical protein n=1 Tax=Thalassospira sp. MCCC 1A01428 TaxID=1470575 RepID=UPI000A1FD250|nr:hypothetical protein [Thalassospira sp. MCCC 1A01428]OSQ46443.1 hypothetical protein THS27_01115 [Thalassospira sp. MCCC 1A01428]